MILKQSKVLIGLYLALLTVGVGRAYIDECRQTSALPINGRHIIVDAGHGGADPGKVASDGVEEKEINLAISEKLTEFLRQGGALVTPTRMADEALDNSKRGDLKNRVRMASDTNVDLFISVHQNSFPQSSAKGAQVFYYKQSEEGKKLAVAVQKRLKEVCDVQNDRSAKANADYYILKKSTVPSIIVECGFLSNGEEHDKLMNDAYREKLAWAIYMGVLDYYGNRGEEKLADAAIKRLKCDFNGELEAVYAELFPCLKNYPHNPMKLELIRASLNICV